MHDTCIPFPSHFLISLFPVIYFDLLITQTFFYLPRRFELSGVDRINLPTEMEPLRFHALCVGSNSIKINTGFNCRTLLLPLKIGRHIGLKNSACPLCK